ncbi:ATP-binding protein [Benzoatithermus flavus]|uniref:histidine kinase n=1 Tax=Benzoatithermus flavus TaxID=3108223 RepID=A0ABU8XV58_9PROT
MTGSGGSLRLRLLAAAAVLITLAVLGTGLVLSALFRNHVTAQYDAELLVQLNQITAGLQRQPDGTVILVDPPGDPRFRTPYGGRYWQVEPAGGPALRSRSLWDQSLSLEPDAPAAGDLHRHEDTVQGLGTVRVLERLVRFEETPNAPIRVAVALPTAEIATVTGRFDRLLALDLAILAAALLAASSLQVKVGLLPLARLSAALARVRSGAMDRLEGRFPIEVSPLVDELNALLEHQTKLLERARAQAGDLAHGLKTSLQLLLLEADRLGEAGAPIREQVARMQTLIEHQLARARAQSHQRAHRGIVPVAASVDALVRVLGPVATAHEIVIETVVPLQHGFLGAAADLEEMLGNLLDNACKWARSRVRVASRIEDGRLHLLVEDDGPGLDEAAREAVFARGMRLDERVPGSGLGLSIVRDIAQIYDGEIVLARSSLGGLRAELILPGSEDAADPRSKVRHADA